MYHRLLSCLLLLSWEPSQTLAAITSEEIAGVWRARLAQMQTLQVQLTIEESIQKGTFQRMAKVHGINADFDHQDSTISNSMKIVCDSSRILVETEGHIFDLNQQSFIKRRERIVFKGEDTIQLTEQLEGVKRDQGFLAPGSKDVSSLGLMQFIPLHWFLQIYSWDEKRATFQIKKSTADEVVVYDRSARSDVVLDRSRGLIPVRFVRDQPGEKRLWDIDVAYREYEDFGWVPSKWSVTASYEDTAKVVNCAVTALEINTYLPEEAFSVRFPSGVRVRDIRDGLRRELIAGKDGELLSADTSSTGRYSRIWLLGLNVVILIALCVVVLLRRRKG